MRILYTEEAERNIREIFDYISADNPDNAVSVCKRMKEAIDKLAAFPDSGLYPKYRKLRQRGYRMLVSDNYLIFYKQAAESVIIAAVIHGSRKYDILFKKAD